MQLTKLEIKGFKSFGDRVVINFDEGITGIVGPNGCGKSNVVDAIRWVLGEQKTRMLRSEKMENIIFNGTKKRKPLQMAEVSLTFNNTKNLLPTEYSTVTITRRYYRSGDSEYLLNGVVCRLKDITNLFLDTGIASNSYAIIELKMVDDILNDKDNSRRGLFEEAAGISKFKIRKKETLRKLSDTDADLDRVEDLLFEIEKNLKSLEKQARQAKKYYELKEDYKASSIKLAHVSLARQKEVFQRLERQLANENDKKTSLNKQLAELEAAVEKHKAELVKKENLLSSRQKTLNQHVNKIRQYESEKKIKNERLRFLNDRADNLKEQIEQDKKSNERAAFSIKSLEQEKATADKILAEISSKLERLKEDYEKHRNETKAQKASVDELSQSLKSKQETYYQANKSLEIKQIQLNTLKQELEKTAADSSSQSASLDEFEQKLKTLEEELRGKEGRFQAMQAKEAELNKQIEETTRTIEVIREEQNQTSRKLDARQNEYNLTKSLVDNLEGFPEAIKFLKKSSKWGKNAPLFSDILTCPEDYRIAIENYLEPVMNYYIVETEAQAFEAINLLSDASKGKAHFFILENFEHYKTSDSRIVKDAFPATEVVEYDNRYKKLVQFVLDNVYISTNHHTDLPEEPDVTLITKNGKVIKRKFSISGGSVGLFEGKRIGRAKNLEKLQAQIKEYGSKIEEVRQNLSDKQADLENLKKSSHKESLEEMREEIKIVNEEYISVKTKKEQYHSLLTSNTDKKENIQERIADLQQEIEELLPITEEGQSELKSLEEEYGKASEILNAYNELLSEKSAAFNQENIIFHQQENKANSIAQEISFKTTTFESSQERIEKNTEALRQTDDEIKNLISKNEINDDELIALYDEKDSIEKGVNEAEKDYYAARGTIEKTEKDSREVQRNRENSDSLIMEIRNQISESKLALTSVRERISVEFNVDSKTLDNPPEEEIQEDEETLREAVEKAKSRLDKIGPINPMAMEAYEEIKERYDFITKEKEDLITAKESLLSTINEIDEVAKTTFLEAFENIKANFVKVFRSLFTEEDDCDLKLSDPDSPLDSAIEIIAKPKGKRPLGINQLSGGEKTLTATSLLFSIYLLKPAPFCIFDEVDAPLDDANIDKFNNIIKTFAADSQFIIVTHNKRTMASTDVIYGITMIEQGVSRVVPVDLRELA